MTNLVRIQVQSDSALVMFSLIATKLFIVVLFYSFYYLVREVVFFEHLLEGAEAINAEAAFNSDSQSTQSHSRICDDKHR